MKWKIPVNLIHMSRIFDENNYSAYLVGGAVRNMALKIEPKDWDLATNARPEEVQEIFYRVIPTGIKHGTVTVLFKGTPYEVTTFRAEGKYTDGRRPDDIRYIKNIEEDLKRRDFTINSMAIHLKTQQLYDPNEGLKDLKAKRIKAIGNPEERFEEDGLRLLRACRFASQLHFKIETKTFEAMITKAEKLKRISKERIRDEVIKIILSPKPSYGLELMRRSGLMEYVFPDLLATKGLEQHGTHKYDVYYHSIYACDGAPGDSLTVRLAALLHDLGKKEAHRIRPDSTIHFHNHEDHSAKHAKRILTELRFPNETINRVEHLVKHHMFHYTSEWTDSAVRRFLNRVKVEYIPELFALRKADQYGMGDKKPGANLISFQEHINTILETDAALTIKDLVIDGNILHKKAGIPKGPIMGKILNYLLQAVLEDPKQNKEDQLVLIAKNFYESIQ